MGQPGELRRAAAEAFMESLEQLQQTIESDDSVTPQTVANKPSKPDTSTPLDLDSWAAAIADIEQFIQQKDSAAD